MFAFLGNLNTWEILVILVIALLLFGSRLPTIARGLGKSITEFKKGMKEDDDAGKSPAPQKDESSAKTQEYDKEERPKNQEVSQGESKKS